MQGEYLYKIYRRNIIKKSPREFQFLKGLEIHNFESEIFFVVEIVETNHKERVEEEYYVVYVAMRVFK